MQRKNLVYNALLRLGVGLAVLLACTFVIWQLDGDMWLARSVFAPENAWPGIDRFPWDFIYTYAAIPAVVLAGLAGIVLLGGFVSRSMAPYRSQTLFLVLLLVVGPGLLVNTLLKDHWGRARPREIVEFGGKYAFSQPWQKGVSGQNSSFPSGHASVGFYLMAPWFILRQRNRKQGLLWLSGGLGYGSLVGAARIMQGGHFVSDVLWAGGIVYIAGELLALLLQPDRPLQVDPTGQ